MRVTYLKLENVAGLYVGTGRTKIEIDFKDSRNKIVCIQGANGSGKSSLLSTITPFAYTTSLDERSNINFILRGKNGYKEIHYETSEGTIIIKHYYKPSKDTHSVKSYFVLNGEEMNENGNVSSFLTLVETHLGITQEMMRLIRLGSNVNSFVSLTPARRKEYVGKLISEIDLYMKIYKAIGEDIRVNRSLLSTNTTNLYNCHITDSVMEEDRLHGFEKEIKRLEKERDGITRKIGKLESMIRENNLEELRKQSQDSSNGLRELDQLQEQIRTQHLDGVSVDQLIGKRNDQSNQKIDTQAKVNSYRISIDQGLRAIEKLEASMRRVTSDNDLHALMQNLELIEKAIERIPDVVRNFTPIGATSDEIHVLLSKLQSFNHISQTIYTFGSKPIEWYLRLKQEHRSVDQFLKDQAAKISNHISREDVRMLMDQMFGSESIIAPNCSIEFQQCPYYRFADMVSSIHTQMEEDSLDGETLRYIDAISQNMDRILNELDQTSLIRIPDQLKAQFSEERILDRLRQKLPFFELVPLQEYLSIVREHEIYQKNLLRCKELQHQLSVFRKSGIDLQMTQVKEYQDSIEFYRNNIQTLEKRLEEFDRSLETIDQQIALVSRYQERIKLRTLLQNTLENARKILKPLETAEESLREHRYELRRVQEQMESIRSQHRTLDLKLQEYRRLQKEHQELTIKLNDLTMIQKAVSTRKGIPVIYMKKYLGKIQQIANRLLYMVYGDDLYLDMFCVTQDTFEIPYVKNGHRIPDVKYGSQSEVALMTMALSFALNHRTTGTYNVLLLDEIEGGLDDENRTAFLHMLDSQMDSIHAEQAFMISQNISQMINLPMDCIQLSDVGVRTKLQNIIYQ